LSKKSQSNVTPAPSVLGTGTGHYLDVNDIFLYEANQRLRKLFFFIFQKLEKYFGLIHVLDNGVNCAKIQKQRFVGGVFDQRFGTFEAVFVGDQF
jgi:hypothetical protein